MFGVRAAPTWGCQVDRLHFKDTQAGILVERVELKEVQEQYEDERQKKKVKRMETNAPHDITDSNAKRGKRKIEVRAAGLTVVCIDCLFICEQRD